MPAGIESRFTGLLSQLVWSSRRPHDPDVWIAAAQTPAWFQGEPEVGGSGAGWTAEAAQLACVGEAFERVLARALPRDACVEASFATWPMQERAVPPETWVLFHPEQHRLECFPFVPLNDDQVLRWVCCRELSSGEPVWVPEELVYLIPRRGESQRFAPGYSTGLSCGKASYPVLLRGVQEVIERDALVGAWWGRYTLEEWPSATVRAALPSSIWRRVDRPNLRYRFYRVNSPYSSHVTLVTVSGPDNEGWIFSVGSACRENRPQSWEKSLLEAIQGRHCCRRLLGQWQENGRPPLVAPSTFFEHALYYLINPARLAETPLHQPPSPTTLDLGQHEGLPELQTRLGPVHPVLVRHLTPPGFQELFPDWKVFRVLIPGLQPLHGDSRLPFLGGPLWQPRSWSEWPRVPPHPFA